MIDPSLDFNPNEPYPYPKTFMEKEMRLNSSLKIFGAPTLNSTEPKIDFPQSLRQKPFQVIPTQNYFFADDELLQPRNQLEVKKMKGYDLKENIDLGIKSLYRQGKLRKNEYQYLPAMVSVKTKDFVLDNGETFNIDQISPGVDLLCLIDISGSMQGDKIELVKSTLNIFVNILTQNDRLQLIVFNGSAEKLTPLKRLTSENKEYFRQQISKIIAHGGTSISSATQIAIKQLENRRYRNNVTSVFLLSDGQNNTHDAEQVIMTQFENVKEEFTFHTFGIGNDHDYKLMTALSKLKNGNFYYLQTVELLNQYFSNAIGGLVSVVGCNLELNIQCYPEQPFQQIQIGKTYGDLWHTIKKNREYQIKVTQISAGQQKDFVFELLLPQTNQKIVPHQRMANIIKVQLQIRNSQTGQVIQKSSGLQLVFFNEDEIVLNNEQDIQVALQYQRIQTSQAIEQAVQACDKGQFQVAQKILTDKISQIQENKQVCQLAPSNIIQLNQASQGSQNGCYQQYGQIQMRQMQYNNINQQGCTAYFDPQGRQVFCGQSNSNAAQNFIENRATITNSLPNGDISNMGKKYHYDRISHSISD